MPLSTSLRSTCSCCKVAFALASKSQSVWSRSKKRCLYFMNVRIEVRFVKGSKLLNNMNAVITGASRGIGKATARMFALHGYDLYLSSKNEGNLLQTIEELKKDFPNVSIDGKAFDLGIKQQAQLFGEWINTNADTIDVLVNNAGTFIQGNVSDEPDGALEEMMETNLYSAYHLTRTVLPK